MQDERPTPVRALLGRRNDFLQLVLLAVLLAVGINLCSEALSSIPVVRRYLPEIGLGVTSLALIWVLLMTFRERSASATFEAAFVVHKSTKEILEIPGYDFGEQLPQTLEAVFAENKALKEAWLREPLVHEEEDSEEGDAEERLDEQSKPGLSTSKRETPRRADAGGGIRRSEVLLREAVEYLLIDALSLHLSSHFNDVSDEDKFIQRYEREHIPHLLLQNRVLSLLSSPYEDRASFAAYANEEPPGKMYMIWASDGAIYNRFELVLPRGTRLERDKAGAIRLVSPRVELTLRIESTIFGSLNPPLDFIRLVMDQEPLAVEALHVNVHLTYSANAASLLRRAGWKYYEWVDSFVTELRERFSAEDFLRRIQWETVALQMDLLDKLLRRRT